MSTIGFLFKTEIAASRKAVLCIWYLQSIRNDGHVLVTSPVFDGLLVILGC